MNLNLIFSSFYSSVKIDSNLTQIEKYAYELEAKDKGRQKSNRGGWQSNDLGLLDLSPEVHSLVKNLVNNASTVIEYCKFVGKIGLHNIWININRSKDYNNPHTHPNSLISGTFYVKVPACSGKLVFETPNNTLQHYLTPEIKEYNEVNSTEWSFIPEPGIAVYFPSYLRHYVEPNKSEEDRISIAFNLGIIK